MSESNRFSKEVYKDWLLFCDDIQKATSIDILETPDEKEIRITRLKNNYQEFFEYYFPHYAKSKCAPFHSEFANKVKSNRMIRGVFRAFRGSAKSTHGDVGVPLWLMINGETKFTVIVGETEDKAILLLSSLQAELEYNQRFIHDFGKQTRTGSWEDGFFVTNDNIAFAALGIGQSPRGLRYKENRPDLIICDDLDSKKRCKNPKLVREAVEWINDDLMGCFDGDIQRFYLLNNNINKISIQNSIIEQLEGKTNFYLLTVNALDENEFPTWPEKYTIEYWEIIKEEKPYRSWEREYMNNPIEEGTIFLNEWIHWVKILKLHEYESLIFYADPSFKSGPKSDYKAVVFLGKKDKYIDLIDCFDRQCSIVQMVEWLYDWYEVIMNEDVVAEFYMEANFIQDLLLDEFTTEGVKRGFQLPIRPDKRAKPDKFGRIENTSPLFQRGLYRFNEAKKNTADFRKIKEQFLAFEKGSRTADDGPDANEGGLFIIQKRGRMSKAGYRIGKRINKSKY